MENLSSSILGQLFNTFLIPFSILAFLYFLFLLFKFSFKNIFKFKSSCSYKLKKYLFSAAERSFLGILTQAVSDNYQILGKVRIADILAPSENQRCKTWQGSFNRICFKHFDYVLCDKETLSVVAAIELDDKSHRSNKAKSRDSFVEEACKSAGLILIRFDCKSKYSILDIRSKILDSLNSSLK